MSSEPDKTRPDPARAPAPRPMLPTPRPAAPTSKPESKPANPLSPKSVAPSSTASSKQRSSKPPGSVEVTPLPAGSRPAAPGASPASRAARPARPQTPAQPAAAQRLEGVLEADAQDLKSIESVLPSGLSTSTYLPSSHRDPGLERRLRLRRQLNFRLTAIPSALVLCLSTLLSASGWFLLDPSSAIRDNAMGSSIPLTLLALGVAFGIASAFLITQASSLRRQIRLASEN